MRYVWTITDSSKNYKGPLTKNEYIKVVKDFFWEISLKIIRDRYAFKLSGGMGRIFIKKSTRGPGRPINWKASKKAGKRIYHLNLHTNGNTFRFFWQKTNYSYNFTSKKSVYKFIPNRGNDYKIGARGLAFWIKLCSTSPELKDYEAIL